MLTPLAGSLTPLGVTLTRANVLASVPWVAQWKFNNDGNDSIGANHLTAVNSPTFTTGKLGGATGATSLVRASAQRWSKSDNAALSLGSNTDLLISCWVYMNSLPVSGIVTKYNGAAAVEYHLSYRYDTEQFAFAVGNGTSVSTVYATTFGKPSTGQWIFIVCWHDAAGNTINIKINNGTTNSAANALGTYDGGSNLLIGAWDTDGSNQFDGRIDNVCLAKGTGAVPSTTILDALWNGGDGTETLT